MSGQQRWGELRFHSLDYELKKRFGEKVYKIALQGGTTCPNRDGTLDYRGCIFCSHGGSGDYAAPRTDSVTQQINGEIARLNQSKHIGKKFIAYFQSFTGTYAPVNVLQALWEEAISHPDVVMLSIATRPDCLPDEVLELLVQCQKRKPVCLELGLQSIHEKTATYIRRAYGRSIYDTAVETLKSLGIEVVTHVIAGLPGETKEDFLETIRHISSVGSDGVKIQLLHVLEGTDLAKDYRNNQFQTLSQEEYLDWVTSALSILPKEMVIHRVTGDGPRDLLIAPRWSLNKKNVLGSLYKKMKDENIWQGKDRC